MKRLKCKKLLFDDLIETIKDSERIPTPSDDFEKRIMAQIYEEKAKFPLARLIYGISVALCLVIIGLTVFLYSRPAENSYMIPLEDVKIKAKKHPADVKDSEIQKPQVALAQNKVRKIPQQKPAQPDIKMEVSYDLKAHIGMELVEVLDETIKAIERGDQEWEIEI